MKHLWTCLEQIAVVLNQSGITWGLGGSCALAQLGLVVYPNDIDILVNIEDAHTADKLLSSLGTKNAPNPHASYATHMFCEYVIADTDVDLMAGFTIRTNVGDILYKVEPEDLIWSGRGIQAIPVSPPEDWFVLYALMGRKEKVDMLYSYLKSNVNTAILQKWQGRKLPDEVRNLLRELAEKNQ